MKKLLILIAICCSGCPAVSQETSEQDKVYTYIVPSLPAEKLIYQQIRRFKNTDTVYLVLKITDSGYDIWVRPTEDIQNEYFGYLKVLESNRTMHINGKLYPLVFYTDMTIGAKIDLSKDWSFANQELTIKRGTTDYDDVLLVYRRTDINERTILIRFDKDWNEIKE